MTSRCNNSKYYPFRQLVSVLIQLSAADLRSEVSKAYLGVAWWIIEPLLYVATFFLVFGVVMERGGPGFVPILITGMVTFRWFDNTVRNAVNSIPKFRALVNQVSLPKLLFPMVSVAFGAFKFLIVFTLLLLALPLFGIEVTAAWAAVPIVLFVQLVLIIAVSCTVGLLTPLLPDLRIIINNTLMLMLFLSGVFFEAQKVPEHIQPYFFLNPMAVVIDAMRSLLLYGGYTEWHRLLWVLLGSCLGILLAYWLYRRYDLVYPKLGV